MSDRKSTFFVTAVLSTGFLGLGVGLGLAIGGAGNQTIFASATLPGRDFTVIARRATPAVVNISALQVYRSERSPFYSDPFFQFFGGDFPFRVPVEERKTSLGSGVVISPDGMIVTNHHVVERAQQITVTTTDRQRRRGTLVGSDATTDIAVLRIEGRDLPFLRWGDSASAAVGEYVLAVGNPFQLSQTVTMGIVSAIGRSNLGIVDYEDFIQTDAAINPGNSGGALVNSRSELIGVNTAIYSETGGYQGVGFAVPSNLARKVVEQIVAHGRVRRGFVGITRIGDLNENMSTALGLPSPQGAVVWELLRDSPADRSGVEPGDVVIEVNGAAVVEATQLRNAIAGSEVGSDLLITVLRNGRRRRIRIPVSEAQPRRDR
ncbi:MAG: trypsin-like peptidase domain-containing protein [Vicinamibacteria bacterium]|nr:trypsin-like peptidase domain-containing protein [Vicinamibacteria bacterium]